jgi:hypothetical protein
VPIDSSLLDGVRIRRDDPLERELRERSRALAGRGSVWVTDLLDPRAAYYRSVRPQPIPPARRQAMELGRRLHAEFGRRVAGPAFREVRVHRDGVVGQIDLDENDPAEVKTATDFPPAAELSKARPANLEQLAMYCALVDRSSGHLILLRTDGTGGLEPWAYRVRLRALEAIRAEMVRRADVLLSALEHRDPAGLPRCPWRDRGCEFQGHGVCACRGDEPPLEEVVLAAISELVDDPDETERLKSRVAAGPLPSERPPSVNRFSDLVYPRRACFQATRATDPGTSSAELPMGRDDLYAHLSLLLDSGPVGESGRAPATVPWVEESISCFRDVPTLIKVSRARVVSGPETMVRDQPQYFTDLGFRAAAVGQSSGTLIQGVANASSPEERIRAYRVELDAPRFAKEGAERAGRIAACIQGAEEASTLPPCPSWMFDRCPYREFCGCNSTPAGSGSRLQR